MRSFLCPYRNNIGEIIYSKREKVVQEITCQSFGNGKGCEFYSKIKGCKKQSSK